MACSPEQITSLWSDGRMRSLSPDGRLAAIWSRTTPLANEAGLFNCPLGVLASDLGFDEPRALAALDELAQARLARWQQDVMWVGAMTPTEGDVTAAVAKRVSQALGSLPNGHPLLQRFMEVRPDLPGPSRRRTSRRQTQTARPTVDHHAVPEDLPAELVQLVPAVQEILKRVAAFKGSYEVTTRGVALALGAFANRDHLKVARDLEHWATEGGGSRPTRRVADATQTFRTFLERDTSVQRPANGSVATIAPGAGREHMYARLAERGPREDLPPATHPEVPSISEDTTQTKEAVLR